MIIWDIENGVGLKIRKSLRRVEISPIYQKPEGEEPITVFFPDPFHMAMRTFDFPFGGMKAKRACEVEIRSLEIFQGDKYIIWTPKRGGTSIVIFYEDSYAEGLRKENVGVVLFRPVCLLHLCEEGVLAVDIGTESVSIAYSSDGHLGLAFFRYESQEDIRDYIMLFVSGLREKPHRFRVCGRRFDLFPFEAEVVRPSDVFEVDMDDPTFTSIFCAAFGRYPDLKLKLLETSTNLETLVQESLGLSVLTLFALLLWFLPVFFEERYLSERARSLVGETFQIFHSVFPDKKAIDPYSQLKTEYMNLKKTTAISRFRVLADFAEVVSPYVIRIEDFSIDSEEISAQLRIREISDILKITESLGKIMKDVKVTSTVRSRDGTSYTMRISGRLGN